MLSDMTPFRIFGNLYFVGTRKASSHLIDTGDGLILIDTGYDHTADVILDSMQILGFDIRDVKLILHSHGHRDHTGGTPKLLSLSGATTYLHEADIRYLNGSFTPDHTYHDSDVIRLGGTEILCLETPGHTLGTVSFFFNVSDGSATYRAGMFGGAGTNQLKLPFLAERGLLLFRRAHFFRSIERLKNERVELMVGNHTWNNQLPERYQKSLESDENPFIDETLWGTFLDKTEQQMLDVIVDESHSLFINYAHRGASEYAPENTMLAFHLGICMGANGIETDVHLTRDGIPVLFHDDTLLRCTGEEGAVEDYTLEELSAFRVKAHGLEDKIPTLEEFLAAFAHRADLQLAIELKGNGTAKPTAELIRRYGVEGRTCVTSFKYPLLLEMREYAPELRLGYLTGNITDELLSDMEQAGIEEICPKAPLVTPESVLHWHRLGFRVRAWGVSDRELMKAVCDAGADGMTVNFPDALTAYLQA